VDTLDTYEPVAVMAEAPFIWDWDKDENRTVDETISLWDLCAYKNGKVFVRRRKLSCPYGVGKQYDAYHELRTLAEWVERYEIASSRKKTKDYYLLADANDHFKDQLKLQMLVENL
jgi:hypothetical protein